MFKMKMILMLYFFPSQTQSRLIQCSEELQVLARNDIYFRNTCPCIFQSSIMGCSLLREYMKLKLCTATI